MPEPNTELIAPVLIEGTIFATVAVIIPAFLLSRFTRDIVGRSLLVIFLFIAGGTYVGFALGTGASGLWFLAEVVHVVIGAMGLLGLRGSPCWVAAGWAVRRLWDVPLHYKGPGHSIAPASWAISCLTLDWLVTVYIIIAYGLLNARRLGFREVAT